jgi:hypothetical protein
MRETRSHEGIIDRTIGRVRMLVLAASIVVAVACGSDGGPTTPGGQTTNTPVGSYTITTVNSKALPVALFSEPLYTYEVTGGSIALTNDGKYTVVTNFKQTIPGNVALITDSTYGTWSQSGSLINLRNSQDTTAKDQATWAGAQLTFALSDGKTTTTYVYTKK